MDNAAIRRTDRIKEIFTHYMVSTLHYPDYNPIECVFVEMKWFIQNNQVKDIMIETMNRVSLNNIQQCCLFNQLIDYSNVCSFRLFLGFCYSRILGNVDFCFCPRKSRTTLSPSSTQLQFLPTTSFKYNSSRGSTDDIAIMGIKAEI